MSNVKVIVGIKDLPPEGLWVSPDGEMMPVQEHLIAIRDHPELFGLSRTEVPRELDGVRRVAEGMISKGWTRYRYLDGWYHFEVDDVRSRIGLIEDILVKAQALPQEMVLISPVLGGKPLEGMVKDVYDRVIMRFAAKNADKWAWSSRQAR